MYSLTFIHPKGESVIRWDLDVSDEEDPVFIDSIGEMTKGFVLNVSPELLTIWRGSSCLLEMFFLDASMIYILRLLEGKNVVREFYLEEDDLSAEKQFTIRYPTD